MDFRGFAAFLDEIDMARNMLVLRGSMLFGRPDGL